MSAVPYNTDLIVLVADKNMEATFEALLSRYQALGIRKVSYKIFVHVNKDPGCRGESDRFLQSFCQQYAYALVVFDREGCGMQGSRIELENMVEQKMARAGWENRSMVIALDPELEVWLWTQSPHVEEALGWKGQSQPLRKWLLENNLIEAENAKPKRPKEAAELALRQVKKPRSSAIYTQIAKKVSLAGHQEPAFIKLSTTLKQWFPKE